ncbi:MAG: FAD binding domain-containing protein, partial [Alphaproteobacteria bacterium]
PGNDHPAIMLALSASFVLRSAAGERAVPADGFFVGTFDTVMKPDEIMTEIRIPVPAPGTGACYAKLKRKVGDFATAAAAVALRMKGDTVQDVAIALTNVGPTPLKARAAEDSLRGKALTDASIAAAAGLAMGICDPAEDQRGSAEYKTAMAGEMTQRALRTARSRAGH